MSSQCQIELNPTERNILSVSQKNASAQHEPQKDVKSLREKMKTDISRDGYSNVTETIAWYSYLPYSPVLGLLLLSSSVQRFGELGVAAAL